MSANQKEIKHKMDSKVVMKASHKKKVARMMTDQEQIIAEIDAHREEIKAIRGPG
jgi:hypothetical protein